VESELLNATNERKELLLVVRSELKSIMYAKRLMKMQIGNYKIFQEFLEKYQAKKYFDGEERVLKYFAKKTDEQLILKILEGFKVVFENSNSAKYANVDRWFEMFSRNLAEEFGNYPYIQWEMVLLDIKDEKPLDFPSLNAILRRLDKMQTLLLQDEVEFLKKVNIIK
jgi:hypothetical protein